MFDRPPEAKIFFESIAHKMSFYINGTKVDTIDVTPENQKDEVPVLVLPGWGATMQSFIQGMEILAEKGRRSISLDHPRKGGDIADSYNAEAEQWFKEKGIAYPDLPKEELRKANTIIGLLDQKKLGKVDVIAHSEGAINVCIAAMLHPEKFTGRTIVLYSPAGLIGKDSIFRLQKGAGATKSRTETMSEFPITEAETQYLTATKNITPDYMKANPLRAVKELWAISQAQIENMLRYLRAIGIKIVVIEGVDDTMFPMDKMQQNVKKDFVDGFLSVRGGHMQIQVHPELFMSAAESMLAQPKEMKKEKF